MNLRRFNESFKRLYEGEANAPQSQNTIKDELLAAADELINSGNYNIKAFEVAFQDVLEKNFPDQAWWEVCDLDIFGHLFSERSPFATVDAIVDNLKVSPTSDEDVNVEEALNEDNSFQYNGYTVVNNARDNCWFVKGGPQFPTDDEACEWIDQQAAELGESEAITEDMDMVYGQFCRQMDKDAEELYQRYTQGNQSPADALSAMGYSEDPANEHLFRKTTDNDAYELVFDFESYDLDFDPFVTYYVLRDGKIPSGWTYSNISLDESLEHICENLRLRLNEAPMSDEDRRDSDLIKSILDKMQVRSNAALTPEEKAVIKKYGLVRKTDSRNLYPADSEGRVRWNRPLSHRVDGTSHTVWDYNGGGHHEVTNGTKSKINYADRARKAVARDDLHTYGGASQGGYGSIDTTSSNAHRNTRYGKSPTYVDRVSDRLEYEMGEPVDRMKRHLSDRRWAQQHMDGAEERRSVALSKAAAEFERKRQEAERSYEYDTVQQKKRRDGAQSEIDKMLKREPKEEGLKESKTFKVQYDSNGKKSAVMVSGVANEEEARKLYTDKKGQKYPNINAVTELDDKAVADYTQKGMKTLN